MDKTEQMYVLAEERLTEHILCHGLRRTPERYEVLRAVCRMSSVFSVDDLAASMQHTGAFTVSRPTIFNTLEMLIDAELVIKHTLRRAALYECNVHKRPHVLLVCKHCGMVSETRQEALQSVLESLHARQFKVMQPVVYLHGLCGKCSRILKKKKKYN